MQKVTKEMLDQALNAWYVTREKARLEMHAWNTLIQSHGDLIASLLQNGHTWTEAESEFKKLSSAHQTSVQTAWKHMDALCSEYQALLAKFKLQD